MLKLFKIILASALLAGLILGGVRIYRRLPADSWNNSTAAQSERTLEVTIILSASTPAPVSASVEAYAIDFAAVQREYDASPLLQKQFENFLSRRLRDLEPVRARFDQNRRAVLKLSSGNWWARATAEMPNGESFEWRLPINVIRQGQTIELTADNAYEKTKKF